MAESFSYFVGDEKVVITKVGEPVDADKFNTCVHRSENEMEEVKRACCGQRNLLRGYKCFELKIFPLDAGFCNTCPKYSSKI